MINLNVNSTTMPPKVTVENLPNQTLVRLADNIAEKIDEEQTTYEYDEVVFYLPSDREASAESIENDFDAWWLYGQEDDEEEVTLEDRISALEDILLNWGE